jgi:hypothetical protein
MNQSKKPLEEFFFESMLKLSLAAILIVITVDIYFTEFKSTRSIIVNFSICLPS